MPNDPSVDPHQTVDYPQPCAEPGTLDETGAYGAAPAGKLDLALPLYEETLKRFKARRGPDHPDTSFNNGRGDLTLTVRLKE